MSDEHEQTRVDRVRIASGRPQSGSQSQPGASSDARAEHHDTLIDQPSPGIAAAERFRDRGRIGIGGMGEVRQAYDELLQRNVAIKTLKHKLASSGAQTQRFLQEVLVTSQLDHPNIVPVYDVGFTKSNHPFFVMKLVRGETLSSQLGAYQDPAPLEHFLRIFLKVCEAVGFAHSRGVIHRDLKPNHIMVGPHGEVYVMDWGLAFIGAELRPRATEITPIYPTMATLHEAQTMHTGPKPEHGQILGTAAYMAPEQAQGRTYDIDARTDIFGLGGILYHLLTGKAPYTHETPTAQLAMAAERDLKHPTAVVSNRTLPPGLCRITMRAMAAQPEDRYQSVNQLMHDVDAFLRGGGWFDTVSFPAGTLIMREGDEPDAAYVIESGACEVFKIRDGRRLILRRLGPGDVFGETAIFTGRPRTACVEAIQDVSLMSITRKTLDYELAEKGWLASFVRALAQRFSEREAHALAHKHSQPPWLSPDHREHDPNRGEE